MSTENDHNLNEEEFLQFQHIKLVQHGAEGVNYVIIPLFDYTIEVMLPYYDNKNTKEDIVIYEGQKNVTSDFIDRADQLAIAPTGFNLAKAIILILEHLEEN